MSRLWVGLVLLAGCADPTLVIPEQLRVSAILPSHGAVDVGTTTDVLVYFSDEVRDPATAAQKIQLSCLGTPPCGDANTTTCADVSYGINFLEEGRLARLVPDNDLLSRMCYRINVVSGIEAAQENVGALPGDLHSDFLTQ